MPAHCQSDIAEVPESVNRSMNTASEGILNRLNPPSTRRRSRSSRGSSWIFSTTLTRQGSGSVLLIGVPPRDRRRGDGEKTFIYVDIQRTVHNCVGLPEEGLGGGIAGPNSAGFASSSILAAMDSQAIDASLREF